MRVNSPGELELAVYQALVELGPAPGAPARLAEAQVLLALMPVDALPERGPLPAGSRMPLASNPLFIGRGNELLQVARALLGGDTTVALGQVVASIGLGGLGKTQLAVELVHRYGRFFAGGVFWLSFANADEVPLQVAGCAAPEFDSLSLEQRVQRVKDVWQSAVPRLLVFDNCEEEALLETWRPTSGGSRVLVTSRRSHWSPTLGVTALALDVLPRPDSIELLRRYRPDLAPDDPGLDAIAAEVGDLPLALHLAGSYLRTCLDEVSLDGYLAELRQSDVVQHASLLGAGLNDSVSPTHHVQSVAATFALCLGRLDREREVDCIAISLLARMACMAPGEPVARDLLGSTLQEVDPRWRANGLKRLASGGLVEQGAGWLRLHRLLAHFVRQERLDMEAQPAAARALIGWGTGAHASALAALIPHLVEMAARAYEGSGDEMQAADLCNAAGRALQRSGELKAAKPWYERGQEIWERVLGPDEPDTVIGLRSIAWLLQEQGDLTAAKAIFERILSTRERILEVGHPTIARSLDDLARLVQAEGQVDAVKAILERALAIRVRALGPDHPDTAANRTWLLHAQGDPAAARLFQRALAIRERVLGSDHPDTIATRSALVDLAAQGDDATGGWCEAWRAVRTRADRNHRSARQRRPQNGRGGPNRLVRATRQSTNSA